MSIPSVAKPRLILTEQVNSSTALKVFLCHASEDKPHVEIIFKQLGDAGYEPWLDEKKILPGQEWDEVIIKEILSSDVVMVCLSKTSVTKAGYVQKEINKALEVAALQPEGKIFIMPVRLDDCAVPGKLSVYQHLDYFMANSREKLLNTLGYIQRTGVTANRQAESTVKEVDLYLGFIDDLDSVMEKSFNRRVILYILSAESGWGETNAYKEFLKKIYPSLTGIFLKSGFFLAVGNRQKHILSLSLLGNQLKKEFNVNGGGLYAIEEGRLVDYKKTGYGAGADEIAEKLNQMEK